MPPSTRDNHAPGDTHFRQLTDSAHRFAMISVDLNGNITYWNNGAKHVLGWPMEEMLGQTLHRIFTQEDVMAKVPEREMAEAVEKGYGTDERWHVRRNGERFWASGEVTPLQDDTGAVYGFVKILQDRTAERQAELDLQSAQRRLEAALAATAMERDRLWRNSLDLLLEIDEQGFVRAINPAWKRVLGYEEADLVGQYFEPFVHTDDVPSTALAVAQASKGPLVHFEVRIKHKQDGYRDIAWTAAPEAGLIYANGRDVTTEKQQAELLRAHAQARLRMALEAGQMGVWEWDMRTDHVLLLDGAGALHGFPTTEPVIRFTSMAEYANLIHPEDRPRLEEAIRDASDNGAEQRLEYRVLPPSGGVRWLEVRGTVHRDEANRPCFMHGVSVDVSQRKRDDAHMAFVANASAEIAALVDPQSTVNKIAALAVPDFADWCAIDLVRNGQLVRLAVKHVDPKKVELAHELHRRYPPKIADTHGSWQIVRSGQPNFVPVISDEIIKLSMPEPERREILLELGLTSYIGVPLTAHGEVIGVVTFITAESGRIYTEHDLRLAMELASRASIAIDNAQLYQAVQQADRDKDVFLATLAHELRNPLAAIANAVTLVGLKAHDPQKIASTEQVMQRQVGQLSRLVDDLLDISRIATGKILLRREPVNLAMIINHAVEASRPLIEAHHHQLNLSYPDEPIEVFGDAARLTQVFGNLLSNAAKFTPDRGSITIKVTHSQNECAVHVIDTGMGIEREHIPELFRLFSQGRQLQDGTATGLGIGLSLVDRLVQKHGGRITVHSAGRDKGSEFIVQLPVLARQEGEAKEAADSQPLAASWWKGKEVLVVDDNIDAAYTLGELLRLFGAVVRVVNDGASALQAVQEQVPVAVLLDIGMPGMNGHEVARRLRREYHDGTIVLIALTGWGQTHDKEASFDAGFSYHWVKPVTLKRLQDFNG